MSIRPGRRSVLVAASSIAASLALPAWCARAAPSPLNPEQALDAYRRILCGAEGEEVLWWFIGDIYLQSPGKSVLPVARSMTIAGYTAGRTDPRALRYAFREAGVILDLSGDPLQRNPITDEPVEAPLVDEPAHDIDWAMQDDGDIVKTEHGRSSTLHLHWAVTSANLLLLETQPGTNAFALAPGDGNVDAKPLESTRTVYAKRAALSASGFVPAEMIYHIALKITPTWLSTPTGEDHVLIVRGIGQKSRATDIVNPDALAMVRRSFPKFL